MDHVMQQKQTVPVLIRVHPCASVVQSIPLQHRQVRNYSFHPSRTYDTFAATPCHTPASPLP